MRHASDWYLPLKADVTFVPRVAIVLRIDKGYGRGVLYLARRFIPMIDVIVYYSYSERVYFSLFNDVYTILIGQHFKDRQRWFRVHVHLVLPFI